LHSLIAVWLNLKVSNGKDDYLDLPKLQSIQLDSYSLMGGSHSFRSIITIDPYTFNNTLIMKSEIE